MNFSIKSTLIFALLFCGAQAAGQITYCTSSTNTGCQNGEECLKLLHSMDPDKDGACVPANLACSPGDTCPKVGEEISGVLMGRCENGRCVYDPVIAIAGDHGAPRGAADSVVSNNFKLISTVASAFLMAIM